MTMDPYDARCRDDQIQECRNAVAAGGLQNLGSGGECTPSSYDIYDQLCTLNFYNGATDYCCCGHDRKALCCRFHYDHKYFRCDEDEDTISLPLSLTATVVISVICTVVVIVVIATVTMRCIRGRRHKDGAGSTSNPDVKNNANVDHIRTESQEPMIAAGRAPSSSSYHDSSFHDDHHMARISFSTDPRPEPSAPSIELDGEGVPCPPPYQRVESQPADIHPQPAVFHGARHDLYRSESDNYEERRVMDMLERQPEPPPAYADHCEHALYNPEINNTDRAENWL